MTYHDRARALFKSWKAALPSTWNCPFASFVTAGGGDPSESVNFCRLSPLVAGSVLSLVEDFDDDVHGLVGVGVALWRRGQKKDG